MAERAYSPYFTCLYDQPAPVGRMGRGTHYSILRSVTWRDQALKQLDAAKLHDLAVIWDEDHDTRIIQALEEMYFDGILAPVLFAGERKGTLTLVISNEYAQSTSAGTRKAWLDKVMAFCSSIEGDVWTVEMETLTRQPFSIQDNNGGFSSLIHSTPDRVEIYLQNIDMLWQVGCKDR